MPKEAFFFFFWFIATDIKPADTMHQWGQISWAIYASLCCISDVSYWGSQYPLWSLYTEGTCQFLTPCTIVYLSHQNSWSPLCEQFGQTCRRGRKKSGGEGGNNKERKEKMFNQSDLCMPLRRHSQYFKNNLSISAINMRRCGQPQQWAKASLWGQILARKKQPSF